MPIVRLGAGQSNSTGKANVYCKQYGDKYDGLAPTVGISNASKRAMRFRGTNSLKKTTITEKMWRYIGYILGDAATDLSGWSVSLSGDGNTVAIGVPYKNQGSGETQILRYKSGSWQKIGSNIPCDENGDNSGYSVSLSGDGNTVAIGAPYNDGNGTESGHTRIYRYS